ncbi:MAG: TolC family protein, partial [Alcaligenaceae bacterium]|nr:TolC family protein [Alcaligenaceae bacterium]
SVPARFWSLGPALALSIFDGGARTARVHEAMAAYDAQAAAYKQTVLEAVREVEDALVQWHGLHKELTNQQRALDAARLSLQLTRNQYEAGLIDYLSVVQVETNALNAERAMLSLQSELFIAATKLMTALGGQWG